MEPITQQKAHLVINKIILVFLLLFANVSFAQKIEITNSVYNKDLTFMIYKNYPAYGVGSIVIGSFWVGNSYLIDSISVVKSSLSYDEVEQLKSRILRNNQKLDEYFKNKEVRFFISSTYENHHEFNSKVLRDYAKWRLSPNDFYKPGSTLKGRKVIYLKELISVIYL